MVDTKEEREIKYILDREGYEKLRKLFFTRKSEKSISNFYYDTCDKYLYKLGNTLRIRMKDGKVKAQLKELVSHEGVRVCQEFNADIDGTYYNIFNRMQRAPTRTLKNLLPELTKIIGRQSLILVGEAEVKRREIIGINSTYTLDMFKLLPGRIKFNYELEVENASLEKKKEIESALNHFGINYKLNNKNKYQMLVENMN